MTLFNPRDISKNSCSISLAIAQRLNRFRRIYPEMPDVMLVPLLAS